MQFGPTELAVEGKSKEDACKPPQTSFSQQVLLAWESQLHTSKTRETSCRLELKQIFHLLGYSLGHVGTVLCIKMFAN